MSEQRSGCRRGRDLGATDACRIRGEGRQDGMPPQLPLGEVISRSLWRKSGLAWDDSASDTIAPSPTEETASPALKCAIAGAEG